MTTNGFFARQQRRQALLMLGRDSVFGVEDEGDFLAWCTFAAARIDAEAGLRILTHVRDVEDTCQVSRVIAADASDETVVNEALQRLWQSWLRLSSGAMRLDDEALEGEADDDVSIYDRPTLRRVVPTARRDA